MTINHHTNSHTHTHDSAAAQHEVIVYVAMSHSEACTHRPDQWHIAASLIDKAYNLRRPLNHTPNMHRHTHTQLQGNAGFSPGDLAPTSELTLIVSEDLFHLTFWFGSEPPVGILTFYYKTQNPVRQKSHQTRRRQQSCSVDFQVLLLLLVSLGWAAACREISLNEKGLGKQKVRRPACLPDGENRKRIVVQY